MKITTESENNISLSYYQPFRIDKEESLIWNVDPSELVHIPDHWFNFSAPHPLSNYLLGFLYFIFFVISCTGNGIVIWIFTTSKNLRTASNVFVVNLAIFDFIMMAKTPIMIYNSMNLGFECGFVWCQIFASAGALSGIGASITNTCIAYDRCETITNPLQKSGKKKAFLLAAFTWIYALPWAVLPFLEIWGKFAPEGYLTTCTVDYLTDTSQTRMFIVTIFFAAYVLPLSLIIYFYTKIVLHVINHEKSLKAQAKKMNVESLRSDGNKNYAVEIRITKVAIAMCFLFVISWTPYAVVALIGCFGNKHLITPLVSMIPACACKAVACIDPYIYAISHPRFRVEVNKRFACLAGCLQEKELQDDAVSKNTVNAENVDT
ncbi:class A rhodopsin-like G-protein coupled receptor GPRop2, putative [Pediculus humanus corporis]|uniref:Class A rhodopsin-like G-protein coupled receptor GPRop2, putative n=1 Tax=Pediculus humanus subsp. corporis TaxID=121224 RepID=E0V9E9_PEDHC|nr:class A rhodopsin-like G-protein coupled receptor GPRop2, putative [Pediculus humanus corporis]EEB10005.1 class A rhodopsin-like G-protein coupled receptor GPRop2, putative [Pediculus humanus corporis]